MKQIILLTCSLMMIGAVGTWVEVAQAGADPFAREMYHVAIVRQGPNWEPMGTEKAMEVQTQMLEGLQELDKKGILVTGGIVNDSSDVELIFIFRIETLTEAQAMVDAARSVKNGFYKVDLYPWFARAGLQADPPSAAE